MFQKPNFEKGHAPGPGFTIAHFAGAWGWLYTPCARVYFHEKIPTSGYKLFFLLGLLFDDFLKFLLC